METIQIHEKYMHRCIELARQAEGHTYPNPMVGAVIVHKDRIIGEGYHKKYGEAHAEVIAINSVVNKELLKSSTIYTNLEPCAHYGKTPPCALRIIEEKIPVAVSGCIDTFSEVSGKGFEMLRSQNIKVITGVLEKECRELNRRFFTFHEKKRPYIILKWAETEDGFIDINRKATTDGRPTLITGNESRRLTHLWRSLEQSILVGSVTALKDNPMLTVRDWHGNNPLRIVIDRNGKLPKTLSLFNGEAQTLVFTYSNSVSNENIEYISLTKDKDPIETILTTLYNRKIQSLTVEGGSKLLNIFIKKNLWDEARVFTGNKWFVSGVKAPVIKQKPVSFEKIGNDRLLIYRNNQ